MPNIKGKKLKNKGKIYIYKNIGVLSGKRTPFGSFNGTYSKKTATELGVSVSEELLKATSISPDEIDQVIYANTIPSSNDSIFLPRHIALKIGCNIKTPASMAQRICASGLETIILAANDIAVGCSDKILAGGSENMTRAPLVSFEIRDGFNFGDRPFYDLLWEGLKDTYCNYSMGETAENLAKKYSISRKEVDDYAFISHSRAIEAFKRGIFEDEIVSCFGLEQDETIRSSVNREKLSKLKAVFSKDGVQTAGNSSLIADGAASIIVSSIFENQKCLGKILGVCVIGEDPKYMGIAPVAAIENLLNEFNLNISDIDLWEINEAFAAQYLAVEKELKIDRNIVNVNGGSIAIGHPLAATGIRLTIALLNELKRKKGKLGIVSACVGGGQATAILFEAGSY